MNNDSRHREDGPTEPITENLEEPAERETNEEGESTSGVQGAGTG